MYRYMIIIRFILVQMTIWIYFFFRNLYILRFMSCPYGLRFIYLTVRDNELVLSSVFSSRVRHISSRSVTSLMFFLCIRTEVHRMSGIFLLFLVVLLVFQYDIHYILCIFHYDFKFYIHWHHLSPFYYTFYSTMFVPSSSVWLLHIYCL